MKKSWDLQITVVHVLALDRQVPFLARSYLNLLQSTYVTFNANELILSICLLGVLGIGVRAK